LFKGSSKEDCTFDKEGEMMKNITATLWFIFLFSLMGISVFYYFKEDYMKALYWIIPACVIVWLLITSEKSAKLQQEKQ